MKNNLVFQKVLTWIVTLIVPSVLALTVVRIILNPWFLEFEYRTPNFPPDEFGFTLQDRLHYSRIALDYLLNNAGISYLGDLHFPEGQQAPSISCQLMTDCTRLYNERELKHMVDVKSTVQAALKVWYGSLVVLAGLGIWAWIGKWWLNFRRGLSRGGFLTVVFLGLIIVLALTAFDTLFVAFHDVFFAPGTWTFYYSDTLIRLFPERFWQDTFIIVGSLTAAMGLALGFGLKKS